MDDLLYTEQKMTYFQTPFFLAHQMVKLANVFEGMKFLEPSAGEGRIAGIVSWRCPSADIYVADISQSNCKVLKDKGFDHVWQGDFLNFETMFHFDRVIMNPPFEEGLDGKHIKHAYSLLKVGGRLVSVVSERTLDSKTFREWLEQNGGAWSKNPPYTFHAKGIEVPSGIVVLDKYQTTGYG